MIQIKKTILTLVALLAVTTGAWADETPLLTIESTDYTSFKSGSKTFDDKVTVTFSKSVDNDGDEYGWYAGGAGSLLTVAGINGYTITSCKFYTDNGTAQTGYTIEGESPSVYLFSGYVYTDDSKSVNIGSHGITKIEVYGAAEPTEWSLTPDETGKKWTLDKMPASNVELQVEYYAESNLFLGKEALADKANIAVKNGETTVEFDAEGKSTATVTEGNTVTAKFTGKKVLGMKVEKKAAEPVADIVWDATNVTDIIISGSGTSSYEKGGVTLSDNGEQKYAMWYDLGDPTQDGIAFTTNASGGYTFTAPTGKAFTKIEMTVNGTGGWQSANLGTGWAFNADMDKQIFTVTWKGSAAASTVGLLTDADMFGGEYVKSIAFYLSK